MKSLKLVLVAGMVSLLAACTSTVKDMPNQAVPVDANNIYTVGGAVLQASQDQGWQARVVKQGPQIGLIKASKTDDNNTAVIDVPFTKNGYSVLRRSSTGFNYNPQNNTISNEYNHWVSDFNERVQHYLVNGVPPAAVAADMAAAKASQKEPAKHHVTKKQVKAAVAKTKAAAPAVTTTTTTTAPAAN